MQNEPNFQKSQVAIIAVSTMSYNEKCKLDIWSKRTQFKPNLFPSAVEGSINYSCVLLICQLYFLGSQTFIVPGPRFDQV